MRLTLRSHALHVALLTVGLATTISQSNLLRKLAAVLYGNVLEVILVGIARPALPLRSV
jgi:hypothetical protein